MNLILNILIILFSIIALILILLCIPATLYIEKNQGEKLKLKVSYLFIKHDLLKRSDKSNKRTSKKSKDSNEKKKKEELSFSQKIKYYCHIISEGLKAVNYILSKTKVKNLYLKIICAEGDAAFRAISFGVITSAIYPLLGIIENKTQVSKGAFDLDIRCDYNTNKSEYAFNVTIKLSLIFAVIGGLKFYINMKNHKYNE